MVRDTASSQHLHIVSCFDYGEDRNSEIMMKRPLIITTQSTDASSLEAEEQQNRLKDKEEGLVWQAFLIGSAITSVLQVMYFAISSTIFKIWGQPGYWILVALSQVPVAILIGIWFTFFYSRSKSGSLCYCMRCKQLDQNVLDTLPSGLNSIRPVVEVSFLFGCLVGSWMARWIIVNYLHIGITVLSIPSWITVVVHIVLFVILTKFFHWWHHYMAGEEAEEEEGDDSFFVSMYE